MYTPRVLCVAATIIVLAGCGSSGSSDPPIVDPGTNPGTDPGTGPSTNPGTGPGTDPDPTPTPGPGTNPGTDPTPGGATAPAVTSTRTPFGTVSDVPLDELESEGVTSSVPRAISTDGTRVLLRGFAANPPPGESPLDLRVYDIGSGTFAPFLTTPASGNITLDDDWSVASWKSGACTVYVQRLQAMSEPLLLNALLDDDACVLEPARIAARNADVLLVRTLPGVRDASGDLELDGAATAPAAFELIDLERGTVVGLASDDLVIDGPGPSGRDNVIRNAALSADGRLAVAQVLSTNGPIREAGEVDYQVGTLLIDTGTGAARLIDRRDYRRTICGRCDPLDSPPPVISADGRRVFFQQPVAASSGEAVGEIGLYVHDTARGATTRLEGEFPAEDLLSSPDGSRIAYVSGGDVRVGYVDAGATVSLAQALLFCEGQDCLYGGFRFVVDDPLQLSRDGSSLVIYAITQADATRASPADVAELFHHDLDTGVVSRIGPGGTFRAVGADGERVAFSVDDQRVRIASRSGP